MSNGIANNDVDDLVDLRARRQIKREVQVSKLSKDLSKRKRRHEDRMDDSD